MGSVNLKEVLFLKKDQPLPKQFAKEKSSENPKSFTITASKLSSCNLQKFAKTIICKVDSFRLMVL